MANNYTLFSTMIPAPDETHPTWEDLAQARAARDCFCDWKCEAGDGIWIYTEEGCDLESVFEVLAEFQRACQIPPFGFAWAETCSKPRLDEFGGGAVWFRDGQWEVFCTSHWLHDARTGDQKA